MPFLPWALVSVAAFMGSVLVFAIAARRGRIHLPGPWLTLALLPSAVTSLLINEPWFAVNGAWNVIRLGLLFSWVPALTFVELRNKTDYPTRTAKWSFRTMLAAGILLLNDVGWSRTQSWDLVQAHKDGGSAYCWLAAQEGENAWIFARLPGASLLGGEVADSMGGEIYEHDIRWSVDGTVELRLGVEPILRFDPATGHVEHLKTPHG